MMITIRKEQSEDTAAIHDVVEQAFEQTDEANLVDRLRENGKATISLVATDDERIVGHILFSPVTIESESETTGAIGLAPLAVLPELQNQGIGSRLTKAGLEECKRLGYGAVVVLGHAEYYPRFGFVPASRYRIKSEYDVRDEVFMILELREGALSDCSGVVKYQSEFNEM
jgi:putative acetyltransferase